MTKPKPRTGKGYLGKKISSSKKVQKAFGKKK